MRIALFHTTLPEPGRKPGGVEIVVHRLANELARRREDEITVFSLSPAPNDAAYVHVQLFRGLPWLKSNPVARLILLPILLNIALPQRMDVLHLHGDDWFYLRRSVATVRTLHGSALEEARTAASLKRKLAQYFVYPLEHLSVRLASEAMAVGRRTADIYRIGTLADNGVDPDVFHPGPKTLRPTVLFVGTWEGRKRGKFLFDIFTGPILSRCPDAELFMVSDFCPDHERVTYIRFPSDRELAALYRKSWVFAYPSVYEGFGVPYVEALASGTPVLCTVNNGAEYVLADGAFGEMVSDDQFADSLIELLMNRELRNSRVRRGLDRARKFHWSDVARRHRTIYERSLRHNGRAYNG